MPDSIAMAEIATAAPPLLGRSPGMPLPAVAFHDAMAILSEAALLGMYRLRAFGIAHVPRTGPLLIVANHQSFLDPPILGAPLLARRHLDYIARVGLFANPLMGRFLKGLNAIPIRQDEPDAGAIREALRRLGQGRAVVVFAEGSRSDDGRMRPFKRGAALLVRRARCPVLCAAIEGAYDAWPRQRALPRLLGMRIMVRYDTPISASQIMAMDADASLRMLERRIDSMRLDLRACLRAQTRGRFPPCGPADKPSY